MYAGREVKRRQAGGGTFGERFTADYRNCGVKTRLGTAVLNGSLGVSSGMLESSVPRLAFEG